jgi:hypothetical protein
MISKDDIKVLKYLVNNPDSICIGIDCTTCIVYKFHKGDRRYHGVCSINCHSERAKLAKRILASIGMKVNENK